MADSFDENQLPSQDAPDPAVYRSAVDWWIACLVIASPLFVIIFGLYLLPTSTGGGMTTIGSGIFLVLLSALYLPCDYTFKADHLLVRCGVIKKKVPYASITKIEKSSNPLSSPALSLKRIRIDYDSKFILISPGDRDGFIERLQERVG